MLDGAGTIVPFSAMLQWLTSSTSTVLLCRSAYPSATPPTSPRAFHCEEPIFCLSSSCVCSEPVLVKSSFLALLEK
jgi:hypothetical protein